MSKFQAGMFVGSKLLLERIPKPEGKNGSASWWKFECQTCKNIGIISSGGLTSVTQCCRACWKQNRWYPQIEMACSNCQKPIMVNSNRYAQCCSEECRKQWRSSQAMTIRRRSIEDTLRKISYGLKKRSTKLGMDYDIDYPFLLNLLEKQNRKCARTGKELLPSIEGSVLRETHPHTVSIDRVDSSRGYMRDNIELVTYIFNICKNKFTHEELKQFCLDYLKYGVNDES